MFNIRKSSLLCCFAIALLARPGLAWHSNGHFIVAYIAQEYLSNTNPEVLKWANDLLAPYTSLCGENLYPFVEASTWSDKIKSQGWKLLNTHHYISKGWSDEGVETKTQNNTFANIVFAIDDSIKTLSSLKLDPYGSSMAVLGRSISLRTLIHYLGDIHQPLHTEERFSKATPKGDQGGNLFFISHYDGKDKYWNNLHFIWDQMFESYDTNIRGQLNTTSFAYIKQQGEQILREYPFDSLLSQITANPKPDDWAEEGKLIAENFAYAGLRENEKLSEQYRLKAREICRKRVALGGYRLGKILTQIYNKISSPRPFKPLRTT